MDYIKHLRKMKITKYAFFFVGLVSASSSAQPYQLRQTPDPSIIANSFGMASKKLSNGIANMSDDEIKRDFRIFSEEIIDHLYHLSIGTEKGKLVVKDDEQHEFFMDVMEKEFDHLKLARDRAYKHAKETKDNLDKESNKIFFKDATKIRQLQAKFNEELETLKTIDKKLLKLVAFKDYCSKEGCTVKEKRKNSFTEGISNFLGFNTANAAKALTEKDVRH